MHVRVFWRAGVMFHGALIEAGGWCSGEQTHTDMFLLWAAWSDLEEAAPYTLPLHNHFWQNKQQPKLQEDQNVKTSLKWHILFACDFLKKRCHFTLSLYFMCNRKCPTVSQSYKRDLKKI